MELRSFIIKNIIFSFVATLIFVVAYFLFAIFINHYPEKLDFRIPNQLKYQIDNNIDFVILGSSVNKSFNPEDTDKRSIAQMFGPLLPNHTARGVSHEAFGMDVFYEMINYLSSNSNKVRIIVPINLRSFSPIWDKRPQWQFVKEKYYISGLPDWVNFRLYKEYDQNDFNQSIIYYNDSVLGTLKSIMNTINNEHEESMKRAFITNYMQFLRHDNRKLNALKSICNLAQDNSIKILFYYTPIDIQKARYLKIANFQNTIEINKNIINKIIKSHNLKVVDYSFELESDYFDYNHLPNEHMNMKGRLKIAQLLSHEASILY